MRTTVDRASAKTRASTGRAPRPDPSTAPEAELLRAEDAAMPQARPPADLVALQRLIARRASPRAEREPAAMDSAQQRSAEIPSAAAVQLDGEGGRRDPDEAHRAADLGVSGASTQLPF